MPRRMIDSSIWSNESFASLNPCGRLCLLGMVNHADDQGRIKANPAYLRSLIFPYDDISLSDVEGWLEAIAANGTIALYEVDGKVYAQFLNWWEYQRMTFASPSQYPTLNGWQDHIRYNGKGWKHLTYNWIDASGNLLPDTCDANGKPLNHVDIHVDDDKDNPGGTPDGNINKISISISKDKDKDKRESTHVPTRTREVEPQPPSTPSLPSHTNFRHDKLVTDTYMNQARGVGLAPKDFSGCIDALAGICGKLSYINAVDSDNGTLNDVKGAVIALTKLGFSAAQYDGIRDSWIEVNPWMSDPVPSMSQMVKHVRPHEGRPSRAASI